MKSKNLDNKALLNNNTGFPPVLPPKFRKLIDGIHVTSIQVEYKQYSTTVLAVLGDGKTVPLDEYYTSLVNEKKQRQVDEIVRLYNNRVSQRGLSVQVPQDAKTMVDIDKWLKTLSEDDRKILLLSSSNFRARTRKTTQTPTQGSTQTSG
jgi:hypothetical protein